MGKAKAGSSKGSSTNAAKEAKHEPKQKKEKTAKRGKRWSFGKDDLEMQLAAFGLRTKQITADGNCFFRSLGDQLKGDEGMHAELRAKIVGYMREHEPDFAPFVEDDESFGTYVARMKKDGVWAGYMEVIAASHALGVNLTIYQAGQPRWTVSTQEAAPGQPPPPMLHLSYHDGQHYNSVRMADDFGHGPPAPIVLRPVAVSEGGGTSKGGNGSAAGNGEGWGAREEARVGESTACRDIALVRRALAAAHGDIDLAIEKVIEYLAEQPDEGEQGGTETSPSEPRTDSQHATDAPAASTACAAASAAKPVTDPASETPEPQVGDTGRSVSSGQTGSSGSGAPVSDMRVAGQVEPGGSTTGGTAAGSTGTTSSTAAAGGGQGEGSGSAGGAEQAGCDGAAAGASGSQTAGRTTDGAGGQEEVACGSAQAGEAGTTVPAAAGSMPEHATATDGSGPGAAQEVAASSSTAAAAVKGGVRVGAHGKVKTRKGPTEPKEKAPARNKDCPCGSKKKYKNCCGTAAAAAARRRLAAGEEGASVHAHGGISDVSADVVGAAAVQLAAIAI